MNGSYFQKMWFGVIVIFFYFSKISKPSTINKYYFCNQKNVIKNIFHKQILNKHNTVLPRTWFT